MSSKMTRFGVAHARAQAMTPSKERTYRAEGELARIQSMCEAAPDVPAAVACKAVIVDRDKLYFEVNAMRRENTRTVSALRALLHAVALVRSAKEPPGYYDGCFADCSTEVHSEECRAFTSAWGRVAEAVRLGTEAIDQIDFGKFK